MRYFVILFAVVLVSGCMATNPDRGARVNYVYDGDTVEVLLGAEGNATVRLLGVDTPEKGSVNPREYEGVPDTENARECLRKWSQRATAYTESQVGSRNVTVVTDPIADRRGDYGRLLAYIEYNNTSLNYQLVKGGYARVYDSKFSRSHEFYAAEARAQKNMTGLWSCRKYQVENLKMR